MLSRSLRARMGSAFPTDDDGAKPTASGATADVKDLLAQPRGSEGLKRPLDTKEEDGSGKKPRTDAEAEDLGPEDDGVEVVEWQDTDDLDPEAPAEEEVDEDPNWNPSGLSESSLKRLAIGFYGWEQHNLIRVTALSKLFYNDNQDMAHAAYKSKWSEKQTEHTEALLRPDDTGGHWELKYVNQGCGCGWPFELRRVPREEEDVRLCPNYCCQREWVVLDTAAT